MNITLGTGPHFDIALDGTRIGSGFIAAHRQNLGFRTRVTQGYDAVVTLDGKRWTVRASTKRMLQSRLTTAVNAGTVEGHRRGFILPMDR